MHSKCIVQGVLGANIAFEINRQKGLFTNIKKGKLNVKVLYPYIFSYVRSFSHVRLAVKSDVRSEQALRSGSVASECVHTYS